MKTIPFTSLSQDWRTPKAIYDGLDAEFHFDFDPCPNHSLVDGLSRSWGGASFVNPPFKTIAHWVKKSFEEAAAGKLVVMLIPARTDTRWWHDYCMKAREIRFIKGRLHYELAGKKAGPAPFPSCVVVFDGRAA